MEGNGMGFVDNENHCMVKLSKSEAVKVLMMEDAISCEREDSCHE